MCLFYLTNTGWHLTGREGRNNTGKLIAIVLGGAAALFIGYIFLLSLKKLGKKDDGNYKSSKTNTIIASLISFFFHIL